jgi:hypothetical protein
MVMPSTAQHVKFVELTAAIGRNSSTEPWLPIPRPKGKAWPDCADCSEKSISTIQGCTDNLEKIILTTSSSTSANPSDLSSMDYVVPSSASTPRYLYLHRLHLRLP